MSRLTSAYLLLGLMISSPLSAQTGDAVGPGAIRIRLTSLGSDVKRLTGVPVSVGSDTIRLVLEGAIDTIAVATSTLRRVDEVRGRRSNFDRGAVIGAMTLGIAGAIAAPLLAASLADGPGQTHETEAIGVGLLAGTVSGAIIGAGIGALSSRERWSEHRSFVARVAPIPTGLEVGLAMRLGF